MLEWFTQPLAHSLTHSLLFLLCSLFPLDASSIFFWYVLKIGTHTLSKTSMETESKENPCKYKLWLKPKHKTLMLMSVRYESNLCAHNTDSFSSLVSLFLLSYSPSLWLWLFSSSPLSLSLSLSRRSRAHSLQVCIYEFSIMCRAMNARSFCPAYNEVE